MKRKRLTQVFPFLLPIRKWQRKKLFYLEMLIDGNKYAKNKSEALLPKTYQIAPVYRSERDKKTCRETGAELYINQCEAIGGFEVGCAILGIDNLTVGRIDEIELSNGFFDYTEKYTLKTSKIHMPARLSPKEEKRVQETAVAIYKALGCSGFARVDMFYTPSNEIIFNEVNTIPGLTSHSRYPNMMKGIGLSFADMLDKLISLYVE